jgi:C_GCAxxG_C_C family probable redox protein
MDAIPALSESPSPVAERAAAAAAAHFDAGLYCAESVLLAVAQTMGVESPLIPRIASGMCGGMARTGGPCGAVTGAAMALGLFLGRDAPGGPTDIVYDAVADLIESFAARHSATTCPALLGLDLATEEGQRRFAAESLHDRCSGFTADATRLAVTLLEHWGVKLRP